MNHNDAQGFTPLHLAASELNNTAIRILLANGAIKNKIANDGDTPLKKAKKALTSMKKFERSMGSVFGK